MGTYTVRQATPTGKTDATYGAEYIVNFEEDQREVKLSRKNPVNAGDTMNGTIVAGKYGAYFKKDPFVPGQPASTGGAVSAGTPTAPPAKAPWSPRKDNSDGQRQGMCINNAAAYVISVSDPKQPVKPSEWADAVHEYASALYSLGDLKEADTNIADIFNDGN